MYCWNVNDLKRLLDYYLLLREKKANHQLTVDYQNTINSIESILAYYKEQTTKRISYEFVRLKEFVEDDLDYLNDFRNYLPIINIFRNSFDGHEIKMDSGLQKFDASDEFIVNLADEFYDSFGGVFSKAYRTLADNYTNRLWFRSCGKNVSYGGNTYGIYGSSEVFIEVFRNRTIQDFVTFFHEDGHGIAYKLNPTMAYDYRRYCFAKTEALFFELLATFYIEQKLDKQDECSLIRLSTFNDYLYSAEILCAKQELCSTYDKKELNSRYKQIKFYTKVLGYSLRTAKDAINFRVSENLHYVISYLTAIELFLIYINDSTKALDLLYKIIMLKNLSINEYLLKVQGMGIEPGKNINSFYELIKDKKEELKYAKKI